MESTVTLCNDWNPTNTPPSHKPHAASTNDTRTSCAASQTPSRQDTTHSLIQRRKDRTRRIHASPSQPHSAEGSNGTFLFLGDARAGTITCTLPRRREHNTHCGRTQHPQYPLKARTDQRQLAKRSPHSAVDAHTNTLFSSTTLHRMKRILRNASPPYGLPCHPLRRAIDDQPWRSPLTPTPHCASSTDSNRIACRTESSLPTNRQTHALSESNLSRLRWTASPPSIPE